MVILYEKKGRIAYFTINRPEALNAANPDLLRELSQTMADFRDDPSLWVGIITGAGERAFSAGADIKTMLPYLQENRREPWKMPASIVRGQEVWKPLIAAVNGLALGGGLEIAMACDIRIASEKASFGVPEVKLGLIPGWGGTQRLPRLVPQAIAAQMLFTGQPISAQEAYRVGLVNQVVPPSELMSTAKQWADKICEAAPLAVRAAKEAMIKGTSLSLTDGLSLEWKLEADLLTTRDYQEGSGAFVEKRKPSFEGR